jgi:hypothetical protein
MPGRNGGNLRRGGGNPKRTGGHAPSVLREKMRGALATRVKIAQEIADDTEGTSADRLRALDFLAKYGLGTTITGTDTEGNDAPIAFTFVMTTPGIDGDSGR